MRKPNRDKSSTRGVTILIVAVVAFVLGALLFKAHQGLNDYDQEQAGSSAQH